MLPRFGTAGQVVGIDEAGRGCLAGPVVACSCVVYDDILGVNDSKKLSRKKRKEIFEIVFKNPKNLVSFGVVEPEEIDNINILQATLKAMEISFNNLKLNNVEILVDGNRGFNSVCKTVIKGDAKYFEIATASILAKEFRDRIMDDFSKTYPDYFFEKNFGYGTKQHIDAIKSFGKLSIHRKTFLKNILDNKDRSLMLF